MISLDFTFDVSVTPTHLQKTFQLN